MLSATRCITNLQEALPRSHSVLVEAVPVLLQKLKRIEYIDVAEQSLVILEVISRRNAKHIVVASGVQAVISHVDFFIDQQNIAAIHERQSGGELTKRLGFTSDIHHKPKEELIQAGF